ADSWSPYRREWAGPGAGGGPDLLTVCTYNILNEKFVHLAGYEYCSPELKTSAFRWRRIVAELAEFQADLVGFQEVNYEAMAATDTCDRLKAMGYRCVSSPIESSVALLTIYRPERLTVLESRTALLHVLAADLPGFRADALPELSAGGYSAQLTAFRQPGDSPVLVAANLHARWENFAKPAVKRLQLLAVWRAAVAMATSHAGLCGRPGPVLLLGDFNSRPLDSPYAMLSGRRAEVGDADEADESPECVKQFAAAAAAGCSGQLSQPLLSVYATVTGGEPPSTSHCVDIDGESFGCLDYVWLGGHGLRPAAALLLPPPELVKNLPDERFPSDHLPVAVRLAPC
ncbi:hypothetical protein BOX15_Mlig023064g3, partial [Macrostomum lignano]